MTRLLLVATCAFLLIAPSAGSAGLRSTALILSACALGLLHYRDRALAAGPCPRLALSGYVAFSLLAVASLGWSIRPEYTLMELRPEVLYGTLAVAVFFLAARDFESWAAWHWSLLAGSLVVLVLHLVQPTIPFQLTRHAILGQGGMWSTHLVLIAPFVLAIGWPGPWGRGRSHLVQAGALLLLFAAAWQTGNRIVWLALAAQLAVVAACANGRIGSGDRRSRTLLWILLLAIVVVVAAFVSSLNDRSAIVTPGESLAEGLARDVRPRIWSIAWSRFLDAPWLGHGFGREILADYFLPVTPDHLGHPPIQHAHNVFVDMALELGIAGLSIFLLLLVALAREYRACLRDERVAPLGVLGLALLAGFVVKNLTDDFLHRHNGVVFWALNGLLLGLAASRRRLR